jgi:hypothetical protein
MATVVTSPWPRRWAAAPARPKPTFFRGFFLPFSLIGSALRHNALGRAYLRVSLVRVLLMVAFAAGSAAIDSPLLGAIDRAMHAHPLPAPRHTRPLSKLGSKLESYGQDLEDRGRREMKPPPALGENDAGTVEVARRSKAWFLWIIAFFSAPEAILVFFSRRWDDWFGFHFSSLARVRPETSAPEPPRLTFDLRWVLKKVRKRIQGWLLFSAGLPVLLLLRYVPSVGDVLFACALTAWGWYWYAVSTAGKSAHAWADVATAPPPTFVRGLESLSRGLGPASVYARLWARISRRVSSPAATFERAPASFLGLALARAILSLPGLYLFARPLLPVAAGVLCAETDPQDRFSSTSSA